MLSEGEKSVYHTLYMNKEGIHLREICRISKLTLPAVAKHISNGEAEGTITSEKKAQLKICRLNFKNPRLVPVMQSVELERFHKLPYSIRDSFNSFMSGLREKPLISLIFGSFAKGGYGKESDLDVLLVFQRIDDKLIKDIELSASRIKGRTMVNIQPVSLGYDEFERGLFKGENEFMTDIRKYALVLHGLGMYLKLLGRFYA